MENKMSILVEYSEASLFGSQDPKEEGLDAEASVRRFGESLRNYLYDEYPDASITVRSGINDNVVVNGQTDHEEVPWVDNLVEKCYQGDDWLVYES